MGKNININKNEKLVENVVKMENISSNEFFVTKNFEPKRVLENVSLLIKRKQVVAISGPSTFEIKLLLEIMANVKPYFSGRCVLIERGMMRLKRIILPHVFYIGTSEMIYKNMNVLEFLMFATAKSGLNEVERQDQVFESLINVGLGNISLSPISMLTREERVVIALLVSAYSKSNLIIVNLPQYVYDERLIGAIKKISDFIVRKGKTLVIGTQSCSLIQEACTDVVYISDGNVIYHGEVEKFQKTFDRIAFYIEDSNILEIYNKLAPLLPEYYLKIIDNSTMTISNYLDDEQDATLLYNKLIEAGITPESVRINSKTVQNAYEEMMRRYDLQK